MSGNGLVNSRRSRNETNDNCQELLKTYRIKTFIIYKNYPNEIHKIKLLEFHQKNTPPMIGYSPVRDKSGKCYIVHCPTEILPLLRKSKRLNLSRPFFSCTVRRRYVKKKSINVL